ncbi:hypothetical protein MCOR29_011718 [Pyricularia oryzae]|nr:hypothetical protein MCOR29_011718 [Pyricularia oryzae]KAI6353899.1 hypothetical protein MCOR31_011609 [Pyricularia oryzae]KAI6400160.1 hypothetical protein MCOR23_004926 [Pyricularia oryzae]KAI6420508.1 hypothetical protein MCOR22_011687 [Pyricularia oryzae]KAI6524748.1 hypothetical protein MCOR16_006777 [Pyricularia oryzae]
MPTRDRTVLFFDPFGTLHETRVALAARRLLRGTIGSSRWKFEAITVSASHQLALITSLPFVHTARRYYRLNGSVRPSDWPREVGNHHSCAGKLYELGRLEEVKVVTRSPLVNQRRDHY